MKTLIWVSMLASCWTLAIRFKSAPPHVQAVSSATGNGHEFSGTNSRYSAPTILGRLKNRSVVESSGLAASRVNPGLYWTHNDSGDGPFIYAFDSRGTSKGVWRIPAAARDWEDMDVGPGPDPTKSYIYIGDIGDNESSRAEIVIYRLPEPVVAPTHASATKAKALVTETPEVFRVRYPDGKHDAETLMVHPQTARLFVVTKVILGRPSVYEARLDSETTNVMLRVASLDIPSPIGGIITAGSVSPDGRRIVLCDYLQAYELVLPKEIETFDEIWKQPFVKIPLGRRKQGEAITYRLDGKALLATSEGRSSPIIQVVRR